MRLYVVRLAGATAMIAGMALAQYPSQYPTGQYPTQYPPGGYPPSTYPGGYPPSTYPGGYPPNTYPDSYPTRLPGGVPVNLPVPNVKLPKGKGSDKDKNSTRQEQKSVTVVSADGALRRLREKDLLLEVQKKGVLKFRLLPKTKFEDKAGEQVRDSLLHPGDQVTVQVSPDDVETALKVVLLKSADSPDNRPINEASVREPRADDFGKPHTVASTSTEPPPVIEEDKKKAEAAEAAAASAPEPETLPTNSSGGNTDPEIIASTREVAATFTSTLPNYLVQQLTIRYFSPNSPPRWQLLDQVTADLAYVDGQEEYKNFRIDGKPIDKPEQSGSWSTGEFSTTLEDVFSPMTNASFRRRGEQKMAGRNALVFDYSVQQTNSHWVIVSPDGRQYKPAYDGAVWIDQDTHRVLKIEQHAKGLPPGWPHRDIEAVLEYGYAKIEQKTYLLPDRAENSACMSGSGACTRNVIEFRNYRKFSTESNISFGK